MDDRWIMFGWLMVWRDKWQWHGCISYISLCNKLPQNSVPSNKHLWDFPGSPVVETSPSNAGGAGSIPGRGAKIPHASGPKNQNIKQMQYCYIFNKDFKNGPHQEKKKLKKIKTQTFIMSHNFWESGIWEQLSWMVFSESLMRLKSSSQAGP